MVSNEGGGTQIVNETQETPSPTPANSAPAEFIVVDPRKFQKNASPSHNGAGVLDADEGEEDDDEEEEEEDDEDDDDDKEDDDNKEEESEQEEEEGDEEVDNRGEQNGEENVEENREERVDQPQAQQQDGGDLLDREVTEVERDIKNCQQNINLAIVALQELRKVSNLFSRLIKCYLFSL